MIKTISKQTDTILSLSLNRIILNSELNGDNSFFYGIFHILTLNLYALSGSSLNFSFWYRTIDMSNKSLGVDGRGLGWHELGMDPN